MRKVVKTFTKADNGKLTKVVEFDTGEKVELPINKDGSIKWFNDNQLIKEEVERWQDI